MSPRPLRTLASATSVLALVAAGIAATTASAVAAPSDVNTDLCEGTPIWTGDLAKGDIVTGYTTVEDNQLDSFQGTYRGRLTDSYGNDILLFDLSGSRITNGYEGDGPAGIWAGISGSPVYDGDDNLVGSVSYSFTDQQSSTLAGVTPAANVIDADPTKTPPTVPLTASNKSTLKKAGIANVADADPRALVPERVVVGSTGARANKAAKKSHVLADGSGRRATDFRSAGIAEDLPALQPGSNIATSYSYGQLSFAAVGTVTAVCGDRVYAFGHPDENVGESTQTILKAETLAIVTNGASSYKMVNIDNDSPAGSLTSDNVNGVSGTLGTVPASTVVTTRTTANGKAPVTRVTHVTTPYALPFAAATQVANDAYNAFKKDGAGDVAASIKVKFLREGETRPETFKRAFRVSTTYSLPSEASFAVGNDLEAILGNGFENVEILSVDVDAKYLPDYRAYTFNGFQYLSGNVWKNASSAGTVPVKRGATIKLRAKLKAAFGSKVPATTVETTWKTSNALKKSGSFTFTGQSYSYDDEEYFFEEFYEDDEEQIESLDEVLDLLTSTPRGDDIVAEYRYKTKPGTRSAFQVVRAPGLVSGSASVKLRY